MLPPLYLHIKGKYLQWPHEDSLFCFIILNDCIHYPYLRQCLGVARVTSSASGTRSSLVVTLSKAADTLMQQGLLWSGRGQPRRSALYLLGSVDFIRQALGEMDRAVEAISEADGSREGRVAKLENLLTHGFYYLAQVTATGGLHSMGSRVD